MTARLDQLAHTVEAAQDAKDGDGARRSAKVLDGLQGDVLFRTGSAEIAPEMAHRSRCWPRLWRSPPRSRSGSTVTRIRAVRWMRNLKLSEARANAVRDLFLAAGVSDEALEVNAYGKSQSVAADSDGYALERRVRLTLQAAGRPRSAQTGSEQPGAPACATDVRRAIDGPER